MGWTETAVDKIYSVGDTLDSSTVYAAGEKYTISQNTTLYAAWGYDTDGDGKPDVTEDKRTVTYNANGGTFGSDETKTETVPAQPSYRLNTTAEFKPTHADHNSTKAVSYTHLDVYKRQVYLRAYGYDPDKPLPL